MLSKLEGFALRLLIGKLSRLSVADEGSSELLCFGYHVLAEKLDVSRDGSSGDFQGG